MKCHACGHDVVPVVVFGGNDNPGMREQCPRAECRASFGAYALATPPTAAPRPEARPARPRPARAPAAPFDVLRSARARLRELKRELARAAKLRVEHDRLERLLAAADTAPVSDGAAVVRLRRSAAG